jgi:aspartate aminotransferase-like enzyme
MSTDENTPDRFAVAVQLALRDELRKIAEEEIEAAQERVKERIRAKLGELALRCFGAYNIAFNRDELVITVRTDIPGAVQ